MENYFTKKEMKKLLTEKELKQLITDRIRYGQTQAMLAKDLGVSQGYLSDVLAGNRGIGERIVEALGYEIRYVKKGAK